MSDALVPISLLLILALAVCAVAMLISPAFQQSVMSMAEISAHALERHGTLAVSAAECGDRPEIRMVNPQTGRIASICLTEKGWGIYIAEADGRNVTAFVKEKMKSLEQVIRYMKNAGYELIQ